MSLDHTRFGLIAPSLFSLRSRRDKGRRSISTMFQVGVAQMNRCALFGDKYALAIGATQIGAAKAQGAHVGHRSQPDT